VATHFFDFNSAPGNAVFRQPRRKAMLEQEEVSAMLRLKELG